MRKQRFMALALTLILVLTPILTGCGNGSGATTASEEPKETKYTLTEKTDGKTPFIVVTNPNGGETLSYAKESGISLLEEIDGEYTYAFKDMNRDGKLDPFEDWRLDIDTRAKDLASKLTKEQIAGLMLFSAHEREPEKGLTDDQKKYLTDDNLRNVLNAGSNNIEANVTWSNEMQAYAESLGEAGTPIIPVNFSSDPRSTATADSIYQVEGNEISLWPSNLGLAATFNPKTVLQFAQISSAEYRGLGIATALGPQIDLATEPRWLRVDGTFGENTKLTTALTEAYASGSQSTYGADGTDLGWGSDSINVMIKHFPGDGTGEGGREAHLFPGKYAVYPGGNFDEHVKPFIEGGLKLTSKTGETASFMSSYSIAIGADGSSLLGERMGSAYNKDKIDILRVDNNYDGVICTDWGVTNTLAETGLFGMAWGAEDMTVAERHYAILKTGIDMFGGNNDKVPVLEAYDLWDTDFKAGKVDISAEERFAQSAERLVKMMMQPKLFENPYLDLDNSKAIVANEEKVAAGYQAQLESVVMVKNADGTIKAADITKDYKDKVVYIPSSIQYNFDSAFGKGEVAAGSTMNIELAKEYFKDVIIDEEIKDKKGNITGYKTPDLSSVDMAIVGMKSPDNGGPFTNAGVKDGKYYPLSLQYGPYKADGKNVRKESISGDILKGGKKENRSYFNATSIISNEYDLTACQNTIKAVKAAEKVSGKDIPIIVAMKAKSAVIMNEFEADVDAIVVGFSVSDRALFEIILGGSEPQGLLPIQLPADMDTVEAQQEDVGQDMIPYTDAQGNKYDFGYGLNYQGIISDERTTAYK